MNKLPTQSFNDHVLQLNWFVMSMLTLINEASDSQKNYAGPMLCLVNELSAILAEDVNQSNEHTVLNIALSFVSAVQTLLLQTETGNMEWLSPVSSLLLSLEEVFSDFLQTPQASST